MLVDRATELLARAGADPREAREVSEVLVWADHRGRFPQGTIWVEAICRSLARGDIVSPAAMTVDPRLPASVTIDAGHGLGHVAARLATRTVAERATEYGIAVATIRDSSHFGACGYYAARLAADGFIGIAATNAYPKVAPHGGRTAVLGTNPIGFAAAGEGDAPIIGDLSTGALAGSRVREAEAAGRPLETGTALDRGGRPTQDPAALTDGGVMLPIGGPKGFALGILVELLTSVLAAGAAPGRLGSMFAPGHPATSHVVIAIVGPDDLAERVELLRTSILATPSQDGMAVRLPGDVGHEMESEALIDLPDESDAALARTADMLSTR